MAQKAIIFTANRVIKRITTEAAPTLAEGESAVDLAADISLAGGPWKLDGSNNRVAATAAEFQATGLDATFEETKRQQALQELKDAMAANITAQDAVAAATPPTNNQMKAAAQANSDFTKALRKYLRAI